MAGYVAHIRTTQGALRLEVLFAVTQADAYWAAHHAMKPGEILWAVYRREVCA